MRIETHKPAPKKREHVNRMTDEMKALIQSLPVDGTSSVVMITKDFYAAYAWSKNHGMDLIRQSEGQDRIRVWRRK
jgi:hypothetical protein